MKLEKGKSNSKDLTVNTEEIGERTVRFTISKEVVDRDGDILRASGVDFTNYLKNPVFLGFHNSRDFPLGKTEDIWIEADRVKAIVYFPTVEELSTNPEQASEKAKLTEAGNMMRKHNIHSLIVVNDDDQLVGIIDSFSCLL